ncbi:MAG: hypothetical protein IKQ44_01740 [Lachnospiraceae bacterium]|nr:hypothetical protein [Lachnospiraceae bacterium]
MKKIRLIFMFFIMMMLMACTGKEPIEENDDEKEVIKEKEDIRFSDEYLVGFDYGGSSWGEFYECISARVIVCTNKDVLIYMPAYDSIHTNSPELELVDTLTLSDEQYENIEKGVNRKKLYRLKIIPERDVCDGSSTYLLLYDKNENVLKACGGYEPRNKKFWEMYSAVIDNIPTEKINSIRDEYIEKYRNLDNPPVPRDDINDEEVMYDLDELEKIFAERYEPPFYCDLDHIDEDGNYVFHLYEVVDNGDEQHTATVEWYTINPYTGDVSTFFDEHFNVEDVLTGEGTLPVFD